MKTSAQSAELSPLIGKTVFIRHATETDLAFIGESLKGRGLGTDDLRTFQFVTAVEDDRIIGYASLRKTGDVFDIGCIAVEDERKNTGIEAAIVNHLIEHAGVKKVYVPTGLVERFRKWGFIASKKQPEKSANILGIECNARTERGPVLMVYEKK